ncbi:GNAT family N-acetyltransferase [Candidatus Woesebacteria bacterium]|nr:GNAT family N-acetyltransferase [Candidatus Woesebacteria bacterium]
MTETNTDFPPKKIEIIREDLGITLRQFSVADSKEIFGLIDRNRGHLSQFGDDTAGKYESLQDVIDSIEKPSNPNKLRFAVINKEGAYVGTINLTPENPKKAEIGYYLGQEFTGKGYMTKATKALTDHAFRALGYRELYAKVHAANSPSIKVLEKVGYRQSGREGEKLIFTKTFDGLKLEIKEVFDPLFSFLGHGTRIEKAEEISRDGLRAKQPDLGTTAIPIFDFSKTYDEQADGVVRQLLNWPHLMSKAVIIIAIPNPTQEEKGGFRYYNSIFKEVEKDTGYNSPYLIPPGYIRGYVDVDRQIFVPNPNFNPEKPRV